MIYKIYQVDAFTERLFSGNPAAVCPLSEWPGDVAMQNIAMENNLAETAFYVKEGDRFNIRWFTPTVEVDLCGHATLAAAFVLFNLEGYEEDSIRFFSHRSGMLTVSRQDDWLTLDFPVDHFEEVDLSDSFTSGFNLRPVQAFKGKTDYLLIFENEDAIRNLTPDFTRIVKWDCRGVIVSARGDNTDFVSRFFAPQSGIPEDPVTGSAHTTLTPYWAKELGKNELTAAQLSLRGGLLKCRLNGERVAISGKATLYLRGEVLID